MNKAVSLAALALAIVPSPGLAAKAGSAGCPWQAAWASSQMVATGDNALPAGALADATLRQIVRPSIGGGQVRVRFSNAFGSAPLHIAGATLALSTGNAGSSIAPETLQTLRFSGRDHAVIPPGADWLSDPVKLPVRAFADLAVSLRLQGDVREQTSHPGSRATSYLTPGDVLRAAAFPQSTLATDHWFLLSGIEVQSCAARPGVIVLGDSITDGRGSTTNGNDRWTDALARRLGGRMAVINQGIGGNRVLRDGLGPSAMARLDRDVLSQPGIGHLVLLEGINDIGSLGQNRNVTAQDHDALVAQLTSAYAQIVERAHARGLKVHGATLLPFGGNEYYSPDALTEAGRQAVNAWIRNSGKFDSVIDLETVMRDPARPDRLAPAYDSGDGLHPNPAGFRAMAQAIALSIFGG